MHKPSRVTVFIFIGSQFTVIHSLCTLENSDVNTSFITGLKKVLSGCSRQVHVNFSTGQVTFHSHLPNGLKGFNTHMQASRPPTKYKKKYTKNAQGEQTLRAACPKGKLEYKFFFLALPQPHVACIQQFSAIQQVFFSSRTSSLPQSLASQKIQMALLFIFTAYKCCEIITRFQVSNEQTLLLSVTLNSLPISLHVHVATIHFLNSSLSSGNLQKAILTPSC